MTAFSRSGRFSCGGFFIFKTGFYQNLLEMFLKSRQYLFKPIAEKNGYL